MEEAEHQRRKIAVAGAGYVGIGIAALLARRHSVFLTDIAAEKIDTVNRQGLPLEGSGVERFFSKKELNLTATLDPEEAYRGADYVVIAVPTDFDPAARRYGYQIHRSRGLYRDYPQKAGWPEAALLPGISAGVQSPV